MAIDSNDFRDALQPQDALALVITLLGAAIAIFLPDSIVKLIGGSIAVLGGIAFYTTLRARINDRVRIRQRRTTLPTPSFKTRVTTDPKTSATRIRFDDFQETFNVDDDMEEKERPAKPPVKEQPVAQTPVVQTPSTVSSPSAASPLRFDDFGDDGDQDEVTIIEDDPDEGFTIIGGDRTEETEIQESTHSAATPVPSENLQPVPAVAEDRVEESAPDPAHQKEERRSRKKRRGGRREQRQEEKPAVQEKIVSPVVREEGEEPVSAVSASTIAIEADAAAPQNVVRRQIRMVLDELSPDSEEESFGAEPRAEFVRLVNQVLKGIARSIDGRSIIFFWMNLEKGHFIPEASVTQGGIEVRLGERIKLSNDLVSQIARGGVPEIITNISPAAEHELVPYYKTKGNTHSFVGVPVYFRHEVVGVLAADSMEESGFDEASVATLAEYTLLISQLIRSYAEKFDLYLMRQSVEAFERLHTSVTGSGMRPAEIAALLTRQASDMFDPLFAAVTLFDKEEGEWRIASCHASSEELQEHILSLAPDMRNSLAGEAARRADEIYLPEVGSEMQIAAGEQLPGGGSFLALPLIASAKCYGSLILGQTTPGAWVARDIDLLRDLARYVAMAIEVINTNEALEEQLVFDEETGLYNTAFFMGGFDREIDRARDFKTPLSLALVKVETPTSFAPERKWELMHVAVTEVGSLLARKLRPYDLIGRFGEDTFSIALVGRSDQEAYLWAERLRKDIAGHIIPFEARTFSVTVSAGVSNATDSSDKSNVINGARQALEKASRDGGNAVVIY